MKHSFASMKGWSFCIIMVFALVQMNAQEVIPISFETILELGGANNLTIKEYKLQQELSAVSLIEAKEWWIPNITAGLTTHELSGAAINSDGRYFLDVDRDNLWTGLGLEVRWDLASGLFKTKTAKLKNEAAAYTTIAQKNQILLRLVETYYDFLAAQLRVEAYQQLIRQAAIISDQLDRQVQAGLQYESDLLLSKSNLNHLKINKLDAQILFEKQSSSLVHMLHLAPDTRLISSDTTINALQVISNVDQESDKEVYMHRAEMKVFELDITSLKNERKILKTGFLIPEFRLNYYNGFSGALNGNVRPVFPNLYPNPKQLYPTNNLDISLSWDIPFSTFTSQGILKKYDARILLGQNRIEKFKSEVQEQVSAAQQALRLIRQQIALAETTTKMASEALNQSIQRQTLGTTRPYEVLEAQKIYMQARIDYIQVLTEYNKWAMRLKVARGENM